jgi:hypothetical protein
MLGYIAAAIFIIAFLINATSANVPAVISPFSLLLVGLACLALHVSDAWTRLSGRRSRR